MTLRSMTGYGSGTASSGRVKIDAEFRSVNSRYLDFSCRIPQLIGSAEPAISKLVKAKLARGRVELFVVRTVESDQQGKIAFNQIAFDQLISISKEGLTAAGVDWRAHLPQLAFSILARREVIETAQPEGTEDRPVLSAPEENTLVLKAVEQALEQLIKMRTEEGEALNQELVRLLTDLETIVASIDAHAAAVPLTFADRLKSRLSKIPQAGEVDPVRLAQEVAILAERTDITEEIARLKSHLSQFHKFLAEATAGKKLDFLIQELGREFNTVGSKVQNSQVAITVVEAKATLEKIREQIQNVE